MVEIPDNVMNLAGNVARLVRERVAPDARVLLFDSWAQGTAFPRSDWILPSALVRQFVVQRLFELKKRSSN